MKKPLIINVTLIFILIAFAFMSLADLHFLILIPFIFAAYPLENKIKNRFLVKLAEATPLLFFIFGIISSMQLFYLLTYLLAITLIIKFILYKKRRDYYEIFLVAIVIMLLSSVSTISISFGALLFLFLFFGALMLILAQFRENAPQLTFKFYTSLFLFSIFSFLFSFGLFFSFPRLSLGYMHGINIAPEKSAGFSKEVDVDNSSVDLNNSIIMRIVPDKKISSTIYLTGMHYIYFDGKRWLKLPVRKIFPDFSNHYGNCNTHKETIYLEPTGTDVLFGIDKFVGIYGEFLYLKRDTAGDFFTDMPYYKTIKYDAYSTIEKIPQGINSTKGNIPINIKNSYLAVPKMSDRFINLSKKITRGKTEYGKVQSVIQYLHSHCTYSLNPNASSIEDFVINGRKGYCEHFATAFVLMLRESGVPARLVSGFVTSEWNPVGNYFIVRAKDAHTWGEVYFPHYGWIRFDPTPAAQESKRSNFSLLLDSIKMSWYRNVITYDTSRQLGLLSSIGKATKSVSYGINNIFNSVKLFLREWKFIGLCIAIFIILLIFIGKKPKKKIFNRILSLIGKDKKPYETLLEYAKRKNKYEMLKDLLYLYYVYRFSRKKVPISKLAHLERSIAERIR